MHSPLLLSNDNTLSNIIGLISLKYKMFLNNFRKQQYIDDNPVDNFHHVFYN